MLFLDVTSSCKSPMNTGVQRVVRAIHRTFRERMKVVPMIWDDQLQSYCRLSRRELAFLERNNSSALEPVSEPEHAANPWPWSRLQRHLAHRAHRLDPVSRWQTGDALFVPEIFQDRRIDWLAANKPPGVTRTALFHDAIVWRHPELSPPRRLARFEDYMISLADFDLVLVTAQQSAADLLAFWQSQQVAPRPRISIHPLSVDDASNPRPAHLALDNSRILCVSTLEQRKNHLNLLAAAEQLWASGLAFELELIGRTTRHWGGRVVAEVERLAGLGRRITWRKHVDEPTLSQAYATCRFTVFPSLVEGFGLPIVESIWHGKPCICGDRGAIAETARGGGCRLIDVSDVATLAAAMRELLTNDTALAQLSQDAARRDFPTWADYAGRVQREILGAKAS